MSGRSARHALPALAIVMVATVAVFLIGRQWEPAMVALVGGIAAVLLARGREDDAPTTPVAEPQESPLGQVLDAVADPVLLVSAGRVTLANRAARTLLGTHIIGEDARVAIRHPAAAAALAAPGGQPVELVGIGARDRRWEMRVAAVSDDLAVVDLIDRTEYAAAERMRVDFVANASHELRTPLASILGYIETLGEEAGEEPAIRKRFLKIMMDEARRMQRLVEDLLSLSRIEADKYRLPDQPIDLGVLLGEVCVELRSSGSARAADVECVVAEGIGTIAGDRAQLSQLFHNLLGNAMKYGRAATPVIARIDRVPTGVAIIVTDQGDGIAPEHLPRLTERFYRADPGRSRSLGGTGLGLAIVKHVAERHRGRLDIASRVGVGTTVTVTLPPPPSGSLPGSTVMKA
ncbi:ATPase [Sphingomonas sp. Leaf339]|uniref:ATP-binding protein n=1 Tax=Sphingomonas sp. Leaf339 TaxID=1736343 RepID=UPI0006FAD15B|nr:ATP-binding protein [Sphingomonas sp. Leaf339]KQU49845.1 ATPase [Sphingomonas sp. Leaf339]